MHRDDAAELFGAVLPGTAGLITYRRLMVARVENEIFLEVHPDIYRKAPEPWKQLREIAHYHHLAGEVDWQRAWDIIRRQEGIARPVAKKAKSVGEEQSTVRQGKKASITGTDVNAP